MKRVANLVYCITLLTLSGSASAQSDGGSALAALLADSDARALEQYQAAALPTPSLPLPETRGVRLFDITEKFTYQGEVVSAYPGIYKKFKSEENSRIIKVFGFMDTKGTERRIEVYFTGGDWMKHGLVYIVTNSGPAKNKVKAYFMSALSTPDRVNGSIAPLIDPFDQQKLTGFISAEFLDTKGNVSSGFDSVAEMSAR